MSPRFDGTDWASYQAGATTVTWQSLQAMGCRGSWWKSTQSIDYVNPYFAGWRLTAQQLGFQYRGPYHWLSPATSTAAQLAHFVSVVGDLHDGECIQLDCEQGPSRPGASDGLTDDEVVAAWDLWNAHYPGRVLVYLGRFFNGSSDGGGYMIDRILKRRPALKWWLPYYTSTFPSGLPATPVMWQWGGGGNGAIVPPLGRVDSNQIMDEAALKLLSNTVIGPPDPPGDDVPTILQCSDAYAAFLANVSNGVAHEVEWLEAARVPYFSSLPKQTITVAQLKPCTLIGPLPTGDEVTWTADNFWRVVESTQGPAGPPGEPGQKGDPGEIPHGTYAITGSVVV